MSDQSHDDEELRRLFRQERERQSARVPSFERVMARTPAVRRRPWAPWLVLGAAMAAVGVVMVARGRPQRGAEPAFTFVAGDLRMPTDFLLDIAGAETLRTVPSIGRTDDWFPVTGGTKGNPL